MSILSPTKTERMPLVWNEVWLENEIDAAKMKRQAKPWQWHWYVWKKGGRKKHELNLFCMIVRASMCEYARVWVGKSSGKLHIYFIGGSSLIDTTKVGCKIEKMSILPDLPLFSMPSSIQLVWNRFAPPKNGAFFFGPLFQKLSAPGMTLDSKNIYYFRDTHV